VYINSFIRPFIILVSILFSTQGNSTLSTISLKMYATLVSNSCTVSNSSKDIPIDMGSWPTRNFSSSSKKSPPVPFFIKLEHCDGLVTSGLTIKFNGNNNDGLLSLDNLSSAKNIGIAILDSNKNLVIIGDNNFISGSVLSSDNFTLKFFGQYVATSLPVTAGSANADATFTIEYQ